MRIKRIISRKEFFFEFTADEAKEDNMSDETRITKGELYAIAHWDSVSWEMDDDIREEVHAVLDLPCTKLTFLRRYMELDPGFDPCLGYLLDGDKIIDKEDLNEELWNISEGPWFELGDDWQDLTPEEWVDLVRKQNAMSRKEVDTMTRRRLDRYCLEECGYLDPDAVDPCAGCKVRDIIENHEPKALDQKVQDELNAIVAEGRK